MKKVADIPSVVRFFLTPFQKLLQLRPRPHYAGGIWKQRFHSENASNVFRPPYAGGIWKGHNHWLFKNCIWITHGQGNITVTVTSSLSKSFVLKMFRVHTIKRKAGVFKSLRFEERFRKAPFSSWISVDGRPNRWNKAPFSNSSNVDGALEKRRI